MERPEMPIDAEIAERLLMDISRFYMSYIMELEAYIDYLEDDLRTAGR